MVQSYQVVLRYDGRAYYGWQRLKAHPTVQETVEEAVHLAFGEKVAVHGAGRTDRGAHAEGQSAGFQLQQDLPQETIVHGINDTLPSDIEILGARKMSSDFHVRENAIGKEYEYRIYNHDDLPDQLRDRVWQVHGELDVKLMERTTQSLLGSHDFASFATKTRFKKKSSVREMFCAELEILDGQIVLRFGAKSFLNHMVRNMVRAIVKVGEGRYSASRFQEILAAADRLASPGSAPASGLYLMNVFYPEE